MVSAPPERAELRSGAGEEEGGAGGDFWLELCNVGAFVRLWRWWSKSVLRLGGLWGIGDGEALGCAVHPDAPSASPGVAPRSDPCAVPPPPLPRAPAAAAPAALRLRANHLREGLMSGVLRSQPVPWGAQ